MKTKRSSKSAVIANRRWAAYATASAAGVFACSPTAEGDIHYSGLINQTFNDTTNDGMGVYAYFQLDQPGNSLVPFQNLRMDKLGAAEFFVYGNAPAIAGVIASAGSGFYPYISKLSFGQAISAAPFFANNTGGFKGAHGFLAAGSGYPNSQWLDAGIGFVGFRFDNGSGPQYGWARINMNGAPGNSFTLVDFAWGDLGDSVAAGQVPEPGSLALLAIGGAGLLAWRKRRSKAIAA